MPCTCSDADELLLRGLLLDWRDGRWAIALPFETRARETPNPDGRLYLTTRRVVVGEPLFFSRDDAESAPPLAKKLLAIPYVLTVLLRDNTVTLAREPDRPWDAIDRALDDALRSYFIYCGRPLLSDGVRQLNDPLAQQVLRILEQTILPGVHKDGGDIELVSVKAGVVRVRMQGACAGCPSSSATLHHGIEAALRRALPGQIERVEAV